MCETLLSPATPVAATDLWPAACDPPSHFETEAAISSTASVSNDRATRESVSGRQPVAPHPSLLSLAPAVTRRRTQE